MRIFLPGIYTRLRPTAQTHEHFRVSVVIDIGKYGAMLAGSLTLTGIRPQQMSASDTTVGAVTVKDIAIRAAHSPRANKNIRIPIIEKITDT